MVNKIIFSVEFDIPSIPDNYVSFDSKQSLLDADIIVFRPHISGDYSLDGFNGSYNGKPCYRESSSFKIVEQLKHWNRELSTAFKAGKTIFIYLDSYYDFFVYNGKRSVSGTGRNAKTTNFVSECNNYKCIPFISDENIVCSKGKIIKTTSNLGILSSYWNEFSEYSEYECYIQTEQCIPALTTRGGNNTVGAVIKGNKDVGEGNIVILPKLILDSPEFTEIREDKKEYWTKEALKLGNKLINCLLQIDKILKEESEASVLPDWANQKKYQLPKEILITEEISKIDIKMNELKDKKQKLEDDLKEECKLKRLLYEKGALLEDAIIHALKILKFKAKNYKDSDSEFDAIFSCKEGCFLGEAEGKDNKEIDVTKCRQLSGNVREYYEKFDKFPKGILFGNAKRLTEPKDRKTIFTDKCLTLAKIDKLVLINTCDLYLVCKYILESNDSQYIEDCRKTIFNTESGIIKFPKIPKISSKKSNKLE